MSDVNFLARRARLLGRQLSESWMASAGGLLNELADALEAKAGAEAAGEAVAAVGQAWQGVGGLYGTGAAPWGSPGLETDRNMAGEPAKSVGADNWGLSSAELREQAPPTTWVVAGRGAMTPQQMADALGEVDRKLAQTGERLFEDEEAHRSLRRVRAELLVSKNRNAELGDALDYWRKGAGVAQANYDALQRRLRLEQEAGSGMMKQRDELIETNARLRTENQCLERSLAGAQLSFTRQQEGIAGLEKKLHEADCHAARLQAKLDEPPVHTLESFAGVLRRNEWIVFHAPKAIEEAVMYSVCKKMPNSSYCFIEELVKTITDDLLKTSQS